MLFINWQAPLSTKDILDGDLPSVDKVSWDLAADIYEDENNLLVDIQLPGIKPDTYEISFRDNLLEVEGKRKTQTETKSKDGKYFHREIRRGSFVRRLELPDIKIDVEKASAVHDNGVLRISIPKK